jgi:hypothetical protein
MELIEAYPIATVCQVLDYPRSQIYYQGGRTGQSGWQEATADQGGPKGDGGRPGESHPIDLEEVAQNHLFR